MKINNNIPALRGLNALHQNTLALNKSLEKLSSGLKINKAADDVAGMAISQKMRTQVQGLKQANDNAMDGISMIQTAEGSLNEVHDMLQRMRELAIQSANGTYGEVDRAQIQKEIDHLTSEINVTAGNTEFNQMPLLTGGEPLGDSGFSIELSRTVDENGNEIADLTTDGPRLATLEEYTQYDATLPDASLQTPGTGFTVDGVAFEFYDSDAGPYTGSAVPIDIKGADTGTTQDVLSEYDESPGFKNFNFDGTDKFTAKEPSSKGNYMIANDGGIPTTDIDIQIGANANQLLEVNLESLSSHQLGLSAPPGTPGYGPAPNIEEGVGIEITRAGLDFTNEDSIHYAIDALDKAIDKVSSTRSTLGAYQNRLEHTVENLGVSEANMTTSLSQIRDTDMAQEMAEYTRTNVLTQSATAMLAKSNELPNTVLQLIQG
ncbi:hypothetical protein AN640_08730 [Candidatus Epulonipiscium fishelsonii]|uniref:Uncharacterized protein n=1 Tax=Candidatus Epulonipiscium fishelsonii TaxID=77094 RepID=A0ACC8XCD4_9FIRM|nr:hypothetical protein AN640_08730 [Epulopiscium sp. SCG-D08WGA-EpuloA1]